MHDMTLTRKLRSTAPKRPLARQSSFGTKNKMHLNLRIRMLTCLLSATHAVHIYFQSAGNDLNTVVPTRHCLLKFLKACVRITRFAPSSRQLGAKRFLLDLEHFFFKFLLTQLFHFIHGIYFVFFIVF